MTKLQDVSIKKLTKGDLDSHGHRFAELKRFRPLSLQDLKRPRSLPNRQP